VAPSKGATVSARRVLGVFSVSRRSPRLPLLGFLVYGLWRLWVPRQATAAARRAGKSDSEPSTQASPARPSTVRNDMSTAPSIEASSKAERRRLVAVGLLRSSVTAIVLIAAYYLLPLDRLSGVWLAVSLAVGLAALTGIAAYQVRAIIRHRHSAVRAIEALAVTVPLFLLLFAATYFLMALANTDNFNVHALTRTDSLYFTITVFATVGFGDISATSQVARVAVMAQMILDLLVLGLLVKVFLNAVQLGREQQAPKQDTGPA
jgi:voltage-gated potassium channel